MTQTVVLIIIAAIFVTFGVGVAYGQIAARGLTAPGSRPLD